MDHKEFNSFLKSYEKTPGSVDREIVEKAKKRTRKDYALMFAKVFSLHAFAGLLTLLICPQFGWSPFDAPEHLPHIFMSYGVWACGLFCGSIFMGAGTFLKMALLKENELENYQRKIWANATIVGALLLGLLMFAGRDTSAGAYLSLTFIGFWLIGALLFEIVPNLFLVQRSALR